MSPKKIASVLCLMAAWTVTAVAKPVSSTTLSGYVDLGIPGGPKEFKDYYKTSFGFGAEFRVNCCERTDMAISYTRLPFAINTSQWTKEFWPGMTDVTLSGGKLNTNIFSLNVIYHFTPQTASPGFYVTAGPGIYGFSHGDLTYSGTYAGTAERISYTLKGSDFGKSESKFGLNGGFGLDYKFADKWTLFAEGKFHYVFTKSQKDADTGQTTGGKTTFITIGAGARFSF
jgi:opacity protein-like surface antigen